MLLPLPNSFQYFAIDLQHNAPSRTGRVASLRAMASGVLCAVLMLCGALSADEGRHRQLHAADHGHDDAGTCAVCLLIAGGCDLAPDPGVPAVCPTWISLEQTVVAEAAPDRCDRAVESDRGPPTDRA